MLGTSSPYGFSVSLNDVTWQYPKNPPIFDKFSWTVYPGQVVILTGKNMIGKTTLLRLLAGELIPESGSIQRLSTVEYLPQNFDETLFPWKSTEWNIALPLLVSGSVGKPMDALSVLAVKLPLWEAILPILAQPLKKLSGGLRHLVSIARALSSGRSLILMDEPFTGLDVQNLKLACASIKQFAEMAPSASIVITTHIEVDFESTATHYIFPEKRPIDKLIKMKGTCVSV
jgi:ABC-type multidrug transport system ATPase subunit